MIGKKMYDTSDWVRASAGADRVVRMRLMWCRDVSAMGSVCGVRGDAVRSDVQCGLSWYERGRRPRSVQGHLQTRNCYDSQP